MIALGTCCSSLPVARMTCVSVHYLVGMYCFQVVQRSANHAGTL